MKASMQKPLNNIAFVILLFFIPKSLLANEVQHVLGGAFEALLIGVAIITVLCLILPIAYYFTRNKILSYILYVVSILLIFIGFLIAMNGSGAAAMLGILFFIFGAIIFRLPLKRKPLDKEEHE